MGSSIISPPENMKQEDVSAIAFGLSALALALAAIPFCFGESFGAILFQSFHAVAVVLPWTAVWMQARWPDLINVAGGKKDPRPSLQFVVMGSGICLVLTQFNNLQIDDVGYLLVYAIVPAAVLACALFCALPADRRSFGNFVPVFIMAAFYGFGVARQADISLDRSQAQSYSAQVIDENVHHGKGTTYSLLLDAVGSTVPAEWVRVDVHLYDSVVPGSVVCITPHEGALHVPWRTVQKCP